MEYADDLGIAFQLTNILRDVQEDFANGRVYLPQSELRAFGVVETEFADNRPSDNFRELIRYQLERARGFYESGERVIPLAIRGRQCLELMSGFYFRILQKIEKYDADVLSQPSQFVDHRKAVDHSRCWMAMGSTIRKTRIETEFAFGRQRCDHIGRWIWRASPLPCAV